jgi:signal transduction histidine kinase
MGANTRSGSWSRLGAHTGTVRVRTTAGAVVVVGVALLVAAITMVVMLRRSLTANVSTAARARADAVADLVEGGTSGRSVRVGDREDEFVQVLDSQGKVVKYSPNVEGKAALLRLAPGETGRLERIPNVDDDQFLVVATSAGTPQGNVTVMVGRTLESVTESSQVVVGLLATGFPLLLIVVAATAWRVVGRALAPVDAIRTEVDAISTAELHRRVPDPPGRDEIARLATTMNEMLARLEEGHDRQRRFVSDASHELRSPVATIRQHAEVALAHPKQSSMEELAEVVLEEDVRLQRLVEDLLLLTRMDERTVHLRRRPVDLDDILLEEAQRLRSTTALRIRTGGVSAGRVSGDSAQLEKLVRNVTENAARHARSTVELSLTEADGEVLLRVDDDGKGIPQPERKRVFERFVRLDEARARDSGGSGLGLAIVAEIAAAHGGSVAALECPLGGLRIEAHLPRLGD